MGLYTFIETYLLPVFIQTGFDNTSGLYPVFEKWFLPPFFFILACCLSYFLLVWPTLIFRKLTKRFWKCSRKL